LAPEAYVDTALTTTRNLTIKWKHDASKSNVRLWAVKYLGSSTTQSVNVSYEFGVDDYQLPLTQLTPGVTYTVEVVAMVMNVASNKKVLNATASKF
jgi:hypothetical protein